jgi:hypothetical protein
VLAAYRPTGKGRVERQVLIAREHVLAGREFTSLAELDEAFSRWVPIRRGQVHRTHGEVIGLRAARDHAALGAVPAHPLLVSESHLRRVGRDSMISFDGSSYSVAARASDGRATRAGQRVEVRLEATELVIRRLPVVSPTGAALELGRHPRAQARGQRVVDPVHWAELPDGHTRATTVEPTHPTSEQTALEDRGEPAPAVRTEARAGFGVEVVHRPLTDYDVLAGLAPPPTAVSQRGHSSALVGAA